MQYDRHGRLHDNQQKVKLSVDDSLNVCSDGSQVVPLSLDTIKLCSVEFTIPGVLSDTGTLESTSIVASCGCTTSLVESESTTRESTHTKQWLQNGDISIKHETINQMNYQENTVKFKYPAFQSFRLRMKSFSDSSAGFELAMLVVIGTDCIGSYKFNYHTITTTTTPHYIIIFFA
jgi:hypothetical protein